MEKISTISVEFVRPGPSHNQLLSPLTRYLALCGDFPAADLAVPYEHRYFMRRLRHLQTPPERTKDAQKQRLTALGELGRRMAELLNQIPGLAAGLANARQAQGSLTHLQLTMSAAELALLPFELCAMPPSCGGGGQNLLLLQNDVPLCMTRTVRGVSRDHVRWPCLPKILFVAAAPAGPRIPLQAHVQALLASVLPLADQEKLDPEQEHAEKAAGEGNLRKAIEEHMTILPNATIYDVQKACQHTAYTHVHVLAHGIVDEKTEAPSIGLAMPGKRGGIDIVTGDRFATALKTACSVDGRDVASLPSVVTLATCQSGKIDDVVYSGASFAHAVHQAGVPFVVASQFPLSFEGSVHMVDVLYRELLMGEDPRVAIHTVRRKLYTLKAADTHDWASLVVYAALPPDLDLQLEKARYELARKRIDMALQEIDMIIKREEKRKEKEKGEKKEKEKKEGAEEEARPDKIEYEGIREKLERVKELASRLPEHGAYATEVKGLRGATYKRIAETHFRCMPLQEVNEDQEQERDQKKPAPECYKALTESKDYYWQAVRENFHMSKEERQIKVSRHWALVQYLCLRAVLGDTLRPELWYAAKASADFDAKSRNPQSQIEARSSLAELYLLLLAYAAEDESKFGRRLLPGQAKAKVEEIKQQAAEHVRAVVELAQDEAGNFIVYATGRQLRRYIDWWGTSKFVGLLPGRDSDRRNEKDWSDSKDGVIPLAKELLDLLPEPDQA